MTVFILYQIIIPLTLPNVLEIGFKYMISIVTLV